MPEADPNLVIVLWAVAGLWAAWVFVPVVVSACGGLVYENGGSEDPAAAEPDGTDPDYDRLYGELTRLGYEPLGAGYMRVRFHGYYWGYRTRVWAFRSRAADGAYAFLQLSPLLPGVHQVFFATCWADGGILLTVGGLAEVRVTRDGYAHQEFPTLRAAELDRLHREAADGHRAAGHRPDPDRGLDTLLRATERHAGPAMRAQAAAAGVGDVVSVFLPLAGLTAGVAVWSGVDWAAPAVLLAGLAFVALVVAAGRASGLADLRRRVAAERDDPSW